MDSVIAIDNVSKKYCRFLKPSMYYGIAAITRNLFGVSSRTAKLRKGEFWALEDVSANIKNGETFGIIGPNGSGKTTLLKLLNGIFWPDGGKITINGRVGALIEVGAGFHPVLTGRENIYVNGAVLGMSKGEIKDAFDQIVEFADISEFLDTPVKNYSSGMFVRLGFAIAVHCRPDILLVDEILAVGDRGFQSKCFNKIGELKAEGVTTVLVSHNMHTISVFSDRVMLLNKGKDRIFENVSQGIKEYTNLFVDRSQSDGIEKVITGTDTLTFKDVQINKRSFNPGDSFDISLNYQAAEDYDNIEVDLGIYTDKEPALYYQATNKAYGKKLAFSKGEHCLNIAIEDIPINQSIAKIIVAIWAKGRTQKLFWWRIPVEFTGQDGATGKNFLKARFKHQ